MEETQNKIVDDFEEEDEIESNFNLWDYKEEEAMIMGFVTEISPGKYGRDITVDIDGEERKVLPSLTALTAKLEHVEIGDKVKIVSLGEEKSSSGKTYYNFQVFIKKHDQTELDEVKEEEKK